MATLTKRTLPTRVAVVGAVIALITVSVAGHQVKVAELLAAGLVGYGVAVILIRLLAHWSTLIYTLAAVDLVIPEDNRYTLSGTGSAFQLAPYRIVLLIMIVGWLAALMVDPRVRARRTGIDGPVILIGVAIAGSELFNMGRVDSLSSNVMKGIALALAFAALIYIVASVLRTREMIDRVLGVLVCAGCVEGLAAMIQRTTQFNIFNHLHRVLPMFTYTSGGGAILRNGHFRAVASAGHPIELSNVMAMLTPIAAYLALRTGRKIWWVAVPVLVLGNLSAGSRTGIIGLVVILVVFLCLRPRDTLKAWPALIPGLVMLQILLPGTVSGTVNSFFPKGGLVAQQSATYAAHGQVQQASRLSRIGPQLHDVFATHNQFFGEGYATRIIGHSSAGGGFFGAIQSAQADNAQVLDDQWFGNLLETGLVGLFAWGWLYFRVLRRLGRRARLERTTAEGWLPVALAGAIACYAVTMFFYDAWGFFQGTVLLLLLLGCTGALLGLPAASTGKTRRLLILPDFESAPRGRSGDRAPVGS